MSRFIFSLLLVLSSHPAGAQDVTGLMTSVVNGGQTDWQITGEHSNRKSFFRQHPGSVQVKISGLAENFSGQRGSSALSVGFYLDESSDMPLAEEVDVVFTERLSTGAYVTAGHGAGSIIQLDSATKSGEVLSLKGSFEVTLVYTDDFGVTLNKFNTRHIRGSFDTSLQRR